MSILLIIILALAGFLYAAVGFFLYVFTATASGEWGKNNSFVKLLFFGATNMWLVIPTFSLFVAGWPLWLGLIFLFEKRRSES